MSGGPLDWIREGMSEIGSQFAGVFKDDADGSNLGQTEGRSSISEGIAEIISQFAGVFNDDADGGNSEQVQEKRTSDRERGIASHNQGKVFEGYTEEKLEEFGLNAVLVPGNFLYDETFEQYGRTTQVDVTIDDENDNEVAIIECKSYGPKSRLTGEEAVDQVKRLVHVAQERGINLVFSTADGTTDCFGPDVMEVLNENQCFVISPDNPFFADSSDVKQNGVTEGLPPDLRDNWNWFGTGSEPQSNDPDDYNTSYGDESHNSYESTSSNSYDSVDNDSGDSGGSWDLFSDSSDSDSSDSSDSSSSNSDSEGGSDSSSDSSSSSSDSWW